jgi:hypothetical protein
MNTKAISEAIDRALEGTINYTNWDQKIAYLDGLAAICVHVRTNTVILPLAEAYERIVNCRTIFEQAKLKEVKEREQLLTIPEDAYDDEESVFDAVPNELKEEVKSHGC